MTVRIVTDSACDLSTEQAAAHQITVVPLSIRFGTDEYVDRRDLTTQQFWAKVKGAATLPETAAPSPGAFEQAFREAAAQGATGIVSINLSAALSATFQSATLAAQAVADQIEVRVVDSHSITLGQGFMAIAAAKAAAGGATIDEVVATATSFVGRTFVYGAVDTLENLKKGGRIGGAQALLGSLLSIKPILSISTGVVEEHGKQRTRTKALAQLVTLVEEAKATYGEILELAVVHGDAPDVEPFLQMMKAQFPIERISVGQIGAVIGTHAGPGVMGITFTVPAKRI
jgi:DegV family protein with EDD domain